MIDGVQMEVTGPSTHSLPSPMPRTDCFRINLKLGMKSQTTKRCDMLEEDAKQMSTAQDCETFVWDFEQHDDVA